MTDHPATNNLLYQQLDEYRLEAVLGQGGMARVYRGFDVHLKRWAAIKVIDTPFRADPDYRSRFEREAQAIAQLKHPHIVGVYRYGEAHGLLYIAMEYIEGPNLATMLAGYREQQQLLPFDQISGIIRPICLALDYAHRHEVIHRDVKPANIILDLHNRPILTDFGLALLDHQTHGQIFGTPDYMAPEQVVSSAGAVPQSDLYSVGIILYEMLTGQLPFAAAHPHELAVLHLTEPPPPPRQVRPSLNLELEAVLLKALAKEPEARYPTGVALADALDQALAGSEAGPIESGQALKSASAVPSRPSSMAGVAVAVQSQAKKGQLTTTRYLLPHIRALLDELTESLSEMELRQLYVDLPDFKPVHRQLVHSHSKAEIIDRLLEYAEQTLQLDELLALAKELNPVLYAKHQPYYEAVSTGRRDLSGRNLGNYNLVERLGQGGMADVYKAYQPGLARYVAIKVIHSHLADDEEFIERFEREAIAVAGLHHPNIVQVFDFAREEELYYMVMELIAGSTLEAELKAYKDRQEIFPLAETLPLFQALAGAIDYAHSRKVIHRDLKPGNILISPRRRVVLTDFGIARVMSVPSYTTKNAVVGTPAYMSPEQAQGELVDERSDIYSLGVILYELVTGCIPFEGDNPVAIVLKLASESWPLPTSINPYLPKPVEQVILKAMAFNRNDRYQTAGEMAQALQQALALPDEARPLANQGEGARLNLQRSVPEIEVNLPSSEAVQKGGKGGGEGSFMPLSNMGQVALGGQNVIQIGTISGGQITVGVGSPPPQPDEPALPKPESHFAIVQQQLRDLKAHVAAAAPLSKQAAALERIDELHSALIATPPDLDTVAYIKRWFTKNLPSLAESVTAAITHPAVARLMAAAGETVLADFRRRFGPG